MGLPSSHLEWISLGTIPAGTSHADGIRMRRIKPLNGRFSQCRQPISAILSKKNGTSKRSGHASTPGPAPARAGRPRTDATPPAAQA